MTTLPSLTRGFAPALAALVLLGAAAALFMNVSGGTARAQSGALPTVVAFGDSLTVGVGSSPGAGWVPVVSRWSGVDIINAGVSGDTTEEALARLNADVLSRDPDIVIVFLGGNDILQNVPEDITFNNLEESIIRIQESGAEVILVAEHGQFFAFDREQRFRALAQETGSRYVPNVLEGILGNPRNLSDLVHPNDRGYRIVADRIWDEFQDALNDEAPGAPLSVACEPNRAESFVGDQVQWRAFVWGGENAGAYQFEWSGDEGLAGASEEVLITYDTAGEKGASVVARSGSDTERAECAFNVEVRQEPLVGLCEVRTTIARTAEGDNIVEVEWRARAAGGFREPRNDDTGSTASPSEFRSQELAPPPASVSGLPAFDDTLSASDEADAVAPVPPPRGPAADPIDAFQTEDDAEATDEIDAENTESALPPPPPPPPMSALIRTAYAQSAEPYAYRWSGTDRLAGSSSVARARYDTPGRKEATVEIESGGETLSLDCAVEITDGMLENPVTPLTGSCSALPGTFSIEDEVTWNAFGTGFGTVDYAWQGDEGFRATSSSARILYDSPGIKTADVTIADEQDAMLLSCQIAVAEMPVGRGSGEGCFIATAAFGTAMTPEVVTLRRFRDETLMASAAGRAFVDFYYSVSPAVAEYIEQSDALRAIVRAGLAPVIAAVHFL